ncbi:hypothetical protein ABZW50_19440 [Streptomyces bacillaris]
MSGDETQPERSGATLTAEEVNVLRTLWRITFRYDTESGIRAHASRPEPDHREVFRLLADHASRGASVRELAEVLNVDAGLVRVCLAVGDADRASVKATQDRLGITDLIAPLRTNEGARVFLLAAREAGCTEQWWETVSVAIDAAIDLSDQEDDYDDLAAEAWMAVEGTIRAEVAAIAADIDIDELATWYDACRRGSLSQLPAFETLETQEDIRDAFTAVALDVAQEFIGNAAGAAGVRHLIDAEAYNFIAAPLIRAREATTEQ